VGKPMALLLLQAHATVTVCHSGTPDLGAHTRQADVVVAAVGRRHMLTADMVKPGAIVIDVGINRDENGKLCGDVDFAPVREALQGLPLGFRRAPRLVAHGRDMGTVVFPAADVKFFLSASEETRAKRRFAELQGQGPVSLEEVERDMRRRDEQDSTRALAPLRPAVDAIRIDSSAITIEQVVELMLGHVARAAG